MLSYILMWGIYTCSPGSHVVRQHPLSGDWIYVTKGAGVVKAKNRWSDKERAKTGHVFFADEGMDGALPLVDVRKGGI